MCGLPVWLVIAKWYCSFTYLIQLRACQLSCSSQPVLTLWPRRTGNFLNGSVVGKAGFRYPQHNGLVFETQFWPNFVNTPAFPQCVLRPGQTYRNLWSLRFFNATGAAAPAGAPEQAPAAAAAPSPEPGQNPTA